MARIRTIKPEFPQSETVGKVSRDARLLFLQLLTVADDEGRARASAKLLAGQLYPYDDDVTADMLTSWIADLARVGLIISYSVDGGSYLSIVGWQKHQKINRATPSRLPAPRSASNHGVLTDGSLSTHGGLTEESLKAHAPILDLGPTTMDHGPYTNNHPSTQLAQPPTSAGQPPATPDCCVLYPNKQILTESPTFSRFWLAYPKKVRKSEAAEAWNASMAAGIDPEVIICGITGEPTLQAEEAKFLPKAEDWLADSRWLGGMTIAERDRIQAAKEEAAKPRVRTPMVLPEGWTKPVRKEVVL